MDAFKHKTLNSLKNIMKYFVLFSSMKFIDGNVVLVCLWISLEVIKDVTDCQQIHNVMGLGK